MTENIILASENPFIKTVLVNAGLAVETAVADLDDQALEAPLEDSSTAPEDIALVLAEAKATEVSERMSGALILGCEQTLSLSNEVLRKPADTDEAIRRLFALSGKTHQVSSAAVLTRDGSVVWRDVGVAHLTMRRLGPAFVGRYLSCVGENALRSAGAYQIDREGIQLFEKIEGDYFTIVGVPLLPLLAELRRLGIIED